MVFYEAQVSHSIEPRSKQKHPTNQYCKRPWENVHSWYSESLRSHMHTHLCQSSYPVRHTAQLSSEHQMLHLHLQCRSRICTREGMTQGTAIFVGCPLSHLLLAFCATQQTDGVRLPFQQGTHCFCTSIKTHSVFSGGVICAFLMCVLFKSYVFFFKPTCFWKSIVICLL